MADAGRPASIARLPVVDAFRWGGRPRPPRCLPRPLACALLVMMLLPAPAGAQTPVVVRITMEEFAFRPAVVRLRAGRPAQLVLVNRGQIAHQFGTAYLRATPVRIAGGPLSAEAPGLDAVRVDPEGTARLQFVPHRKGRYVFACTIEGHEEAGMRGTLDVR